ncbi:MAG: TonB-dependent receptor [Synergistaceae bacterium]|nr:TonB-dependent receptor [Synergistaceae bacterium]
MLLSFTQPCLAETVELDEEVVSASRIDEDRYRSPGSVTVVHADELEGENRSLPDMLEHVPGLNVIRLRGRGAYTVASVRGSTSAQVAVYVDGVLQNTGSDAAVDLSAIPAGEVERVEVYRGYIPARFSEAGMGGVINVVTRAPESGKARTSVKAGIGSFGEVSFGAAVSGGTGKDKDKGKFLAAVNHAGTRGDFPYRNDNGTPYNTADDYDADRKNNGRDMTDVLLKWEDGGWAARLNWNRDDRDLPLPAPGNDKPTSPRGAELDTDKLELSISNSRRAGAVDWGWSLGWMRRSRVYDNPDGTLGGLGERHNEYITERLSAALNASWSPSERHFVEVLAEWSGETLDARGDIVDMYLGTPRFDQNVWRAVVQDSIALTRDGKLILTPSVRWDSSDGESKTAWAAALEYRPSEPWLFSATFGSYSRAPNLYERYGDGATIRPNAGLKWETGLQWDARAAWHGAVKNADVSLSLTYFGRKTDDLIEFIMTSPRYGIYENIAKASVNGVELEGTAVKGPWKLSLSATWMSALNETPDSYREDKRLPNAPLWAWTARVTREFSARLSAFVEWRFVGANYFDQNELVRYDDMSLLNVGVKWTNGDTDVALGVNDLFNDGPGIGLKTTPSAPERMNWYPLEGRSFYLTVSRKF